jgi:hypothetical protein
MTAFDQAWLFVIVKDDDMIQKFTDPFGDPHMFFNDFIDYYPELFTQNLEDLQSYLPESGEDTRVMLGLDPHHQPYDDDKFPDAWKTKTYPEPIRPSGWWYSGYGDPELRTIARDGGTDKHPSGVVGGVGVTWEDRERGRKLGIPFNQLPKTSKPDIDPPPISDINNLYLQTGLQQKGAASLWNRAHYSNMLRDYQWRRQPPEIFGKRPPFGASQYHIPRDKEDEYARKVFPEDHWGHQVRGFDASKPEEAEKWGVPHWDIDTQFDTTPSTKRFYSRTEQPEWRELITDPWGEGERYVKVPHGSDDAIEGQSQGESIRYEDQIFSTTQDLIDHLTSTPGEEEWSERKRKEKGSGGLRGVTEGHDTRSGRRAARRTKRMQDRNE